MSRMRRAERLRAIGSQTLGAPILLDGDATELIRALRDGAQQAGIRYTDSRATAGRARLAVLAICSDGQESALVKALRFYQGVRVLLTEDAVRVAVIQRTRSQLVPPRLRRLLTNEVLHQVGAALLPGDDRTLAQQVGSTVLDAAGLHALRLG